MKKSHIVICWMLILLEGCVRAPDPAGPPEYRSLPSENGWVLFERGGASWYGEPFHGRKTASGEVYDMNKISAAHKTLPLGTRVRVRNEQNGRELELVINDRGPFVEGRIIDLSLGAARRLGSVEAGVVPVSLFVRKIPDRVCYSIQLGAFSSRSNAEGYAGAIQDELDVPCRVVFRRGYYKVLAGRFDSERSARRFAESMQQEGFVVSCD